MDRMSIYREDSRSIVSTSAMSAKGAKPISVVAVDDHPLVLQGIASLFEAESDIELLAQCISADDALALIAELHPDIALVNLHMPEKSGLDLIKALREKKTETRVVLLAAKLTQEEFLQAVKLDVHGIFLKTMPPPLLPRCVRVVHAGQDFIEKNLLLRAFEMMLHHDSAEKTLSALITARELAVVRLAVTGLSNKQVARDLKISEGTVKMHLHRAYEKLRVHGRIGLMQLAQKNGLL